MEKVLKGILFLWFVGALYMVFFYSPTIEDLKETTRSMYFHIPMAWVAVLSFVLGTVACIMYLKSQNIEWFYKAWNFEKLGFFFSILAAVTGSIWAKLIWGSYWNWDPRETSIFFLLIIYGAYLALGSAIEDVERRAKLTSVYGILAFITVPFLVFIVPRIYWSLHPQPLINPQRSIDMGTEMVQTLIVSLLGFTGLFLWIYKIQSKIDKIGRSTYE